VQERRAAEARRIRAERAHAALARYFSPNLARQLADAERALDLGGQRREVSAMFTDIAGFTALAEALDPAVLARLLNAYIAGMTDIVFAHGGTVAKVMGDGMLLLFGAPDEQPDHAARAVACALALDAFAEAFRAHRAAEGAPLGITRIGVHSGPALVGDFGGGRHFDYTAYGETINLASRLEAANKTLGTRLLVSAATAGRIDGFQGRPAGELLLRGASRPLAAFEPLTPDRAAAPSVLAYAEAFARLGDEDAEAAAAMTRLAAAGDMLAAFHARRISEGGSGRLVELA
jgi:adenylate cyclase